MGGESWSLTAKPCDSCKTTSATVFCRADSAFLCMGCDSKIHAANKLASRHARVWVCEVCEQAPASVTCKADAAALCATCDRDIHSANPLARRHERLPIIPFYDSASAAKCSSTGAIRADDTKSSLDEAEEAEAASWLLPNPNCNKDLEEEEESPECKTTADYLFSDMDPYLDMDLMSGEQKPHLIPYHHHHMNSDGVVPVQSKNDDHRHLPGPVVDGFPTYDIDYAAGSKPLLYNFSSQSISQSRHKGEAIRAYMDLEAGRKRSGYEDIFVSYHAKDDVQATYAGSLFHNNRNYHLSARKNNDTLVYWSSSRCLPERNKLAKRLLSLLPHHSFGKCLNNVGGLDMALSLYPECTKDLGTTPKWWDHLHCAMSHYKFVLAIENTMTESYVTEKLFYALDSGAVPIYFGAPNVFDFIPPNSIIDGTNFSSLQELASYVKALANDPIAYAEYHAWRRCGVLGNYPKARAASLDTLPCRLCEAVSRKNGRNSVSS